MSDTFWKELFTNAAAILMALSMFITAIGTVCAAIFGYRNGQKIDVVHTAVNSGQTALADEKKETAIKTKEDTLVASNLAKSDTLVAANSRDEALLAKDAIIEELRQKLAVCENPRI